MPITVLEPARIIKIARKKGLDGVAVTDHDTIKGGLVASGIEKDFVIVGAEMRTEYGDVLVLFLNEEERSGRFREVMEEVKEQGGLVVLAHPFRKGVEFRI